MRERRNFHARDFGSQEPPVKESLALPAAANAARRQAVLDPPQLASTQALPAAPASQTAVSGSVPERSSETESFSDRCGEPMSKSSSRGLSRSAQA